MLILKHKPRAKEHKCPVHTASPWLVSWVNDEVDGDFILCWVWIYVASVCTTTGQHLEQSLWPITLEQALNNSYLKRKVNQHPLVPEFPNSKISYIFTGSRNGPWRRQWQPTPVFLPGESQGRGAWWAAFYGVAQSWARLKWLSSSSRNAPITHSSVGRDVIPVFISPSQLSPKGNKRCCPQGTCSNSSLLRFDSLKWAVYF